MTRVAVRAIAALAVTGVVMVAVTVRPAGSVTATCGSQRWNVKVLLDPAASRIDFTPRATTVEALRALQRPPGVTPSSARIAPAEFRTFSLHVKLVAVMRTLSLDAVLAVQGRSPGQTMLIAFPDTHSCLPNPGVHGGDIHSATDGLYADCGPAIPFAHWTPLKGTADISGIGFWEPAHEAAQKYAAPNGFTLHPAISFHSHGCAQPNSIPTSG